MIYKVLKSRRNHMGVKYKIINIISPLRNHNGFIETHALALMMYGYTLLVVTRLLNKQSKCGVTANHAPRCMSHQKAIIVITERVYYSNLKIEALFG